MKMTRVVLQVVVVMCFISCSLSKELTHPEKIKSGNHIEAIFLPINKESRLGYEDKRAVIFKEDGTVQFITPTGAVEGGDKFMTLSYRYGIVGDTLFADGPFYNETVVLINNTRDSLKTIYPEENSNWTYVKSPATKK